MRRGSLYIITVILITILSCNKEEFNRVVEIPDFDFPKTVSFEPQLSAYDIFDGQFSDLNPSNGFLQLELSSELFSDYAYKQRLLKVPFGKQITRLSDGSLNFPDGSILTKTFFYYFEENDPSLGRRIIETRLLIKESGTWNAATYVWNESQTEASLSVNGSDLQVEWINANGNNTSTLYHIPSENECMTCHQENASLKPLGPSLRNLNKIVEIDGNDVNQVSHLQSIGWLNSFSINQVPHIANYKDVNFSLEDRARAYLDMNCAHCHNPSAWEASAEKQLDLRYEIPISESGIVNKKEDIVRNVLNEEMPFIGTTLLDQDGADLLIEYIESL